MANRPGAGAESSPPSEPLTAREEDVLRAASKGLTMGEVAHELYVSLSTVTAHIASVMGKIGARDRVEIAIRRWEQNAEAGSRWAHARFRTGPARAPRPPTRTGPS